MLGVAALVAVIAGSLMAPEALAAPKKDKNPDDFTIEMSSNWGWHFNADGAIDDYGPVSFPGAVLLLEGALGTIQIDLLGEETFALEGLTGAYEGLTGTGTYRIKTVKGRLFGEKVEWNVWTFQGTLS
jgi:hypothetical protein